ncbi:hypothetical protein JCM10207_003623 [Rhodosporidiobolus poonsookiae]
MLFNRLSGLAFLGLATATLALSSAHAGPAHDLVERDSIFSDVNDALLYDDEELERRAYDELTFELLNLPANSANELDAADLDNLEKRCSTCTSGGVSVSVELKTAFNTCTKKIKKSHSRIHSSIKKCGRKPSAFRIVAAVKAEVRELRVAIATLGKVCLKVAAKRGHHGLTVKIVGKLLVNLLIAVHACLLDLIGLVASAPLLVVLLAGELLAISAQLVILLNALFGLLGHSLKVYVAGHLSASVLVGFRTLGFGSLVSCVRI